MQDESVGLKWRMKVEQSKGNCKIQLLNSRSISTMYQQNALVNHHRVIAQGTWTFSWEPEGRPSVKLAQQARQRLQASQVTVDIELGGRPSQAKQYIH